MRWKRFDRSWDGLDRDLPDQTVDLLEEVSRAGYEPRFLQRWGRNSVADDCGVTVYAERAERNLGLLGGPA